MNAATWCLLFVHATYLARIRVGAHVMGLTSAREAESNLCSRQTKCNSCALNWGSRRARAEKDRISATNVRHCLRRERERERMNARGNSRRRRRRRFCHFFLAQREWKHWRPSWPPQPPYKFSAKRTMQGRGDREDVSIARATHRPAQQPHKY